MKGQGRIMVRVVLAVFFAFFIASPAYSQEARPLQQLSEHVYAYVGVQNALPAGNSFGANAGVVIGTDAVLVVDTLISAKEAVKLLADIRKVTDKPVRYVVNTHYHLDHAWGNAVFAKEGAVVIGHENSRIAAPKGEYALAHSADFGLTPQDMEGTVLYHPTITFENSMKIDLGGVTADLAFLGPTHTDGSITVSVPQDRLIFLGDILFTKYHPYIGEGNIAAWIKVLEGLESTTAKIIVPGHGPVSNAADIKNMKVYLKTFDAEAKRLSRGKTQVDAADISQKLLKKLPDQGRIELPSMVEINVREKYLPPMAPVPED